MMCLGLSHPFPREGGDKALFSPCLSDRANSTLPTSQLWERSIHGSADSECLIHVPFFSPFPCSSWDTGYIRLEVSLSAPPRALKAPWTFWTCGEAQ